MNSSNSNKRKRLGSETICEEAEYNGEAPSLMAIANSKRSKLNASAISNILAFQARQSSLRAAGATADLLHTKTLGKMRLRVNNKIATHYNLADTKGQKLAKFLKSSKLLVGSGLSIGQVQHNWTAGDHTYFVFTLKHEKKAVGALIDEALVKRKAKIEEHATAIAAEIDLDRTKCMYHFGYG